MANQAQPSFVSLLSGRAGWHQPDKSALPFERVPIVLDDGHPEWLYVVTRVPNFDEEGVSLARLPRRTFLQALTDTFFPPGVSLTWPPLLESESVPQVREVWYTPVLEGLCGEEQRMEIHNVFRLMECLTKRKWAISYTDTRTRAEHCALVVGAYLRKESGCHPKVMEAWTQRVRHKGLPDLIPLGQHKGCRVVDVSHGLLEWFLSRHIIRSPHVRMAMEVALQLTPQNLLAALRDWDDADTCIQWLLRESFETDSGEDAWQELVESGEWS